MVFMVLLVLILLTNVFCILGQFYKNPFLASFSKTFFQYNFHEYLKLWCSKAGGLRFLMFSSIM